MIYAIFLNYGVLGSLGLYPRLDNTKLEFRGPLNLVALA